MKPAHQQGAPRTLSTLNQESRAVGELSAIRLGATRKPDDSSQLSLASPHGILSTQQVLSAV